MKKKKTYLWLLVVDEPWSQILEEGICWHFLPVVATQHVVLVGVGDGKVESGHVSPFSLGLLHKICKLFLFEKKNQLKKKKKKKTYIWMAWTGNHQDSGAVAEVVEGKDVRVEDVASTLWLP